MKSGDILLQELAYKALEMERLRIEFEALIKKIPITWQAWIEVNKN